MTTKRLNAEVPAADYQAFKHLAVDKNTSISTLVRTFIQDSPVLDRLREMVKALPEKPRRDDFTIKPDASYPTPAGMVWEYRLPSGATATVTKTESGIFLSH